MRMSCVLLAFISTLPAAVAENADAAKEAELRRVGQEVQQLVAAGKGEEAARKMDAAATRYLADPMQDPRKNADTLFLFGQFYDAAEEYAKAETCYTQMIAALKQGYGDHAAEVGFGCQGLAHLYEKSGQRHKAKVAFQQAISILLSALGESNVNYIQCLFTLGYLEGEDGETAPAERHMTRALKLHRAHIGKDAEYVAWLGLLGVFYDDHGAYDEAETRFLEAVAVGEKLGGELDPRQHAINLFFLANHYEDRGLLDKAEPIYQRHIAACRAAYGENSEEYFDALGSLARIYRESGRFERSLRQYEQALQVARSAFGEESLPVVEVYDDLAQLMFEWRGFEAAEDYLGKGLALRAKVQGATSPDFVEGLQEAGALCIAVGRYRDGASLLQQALELGLAAWGDSDTRQARTLNYLAALQLEFGNLPEAEDALQNAEQINLGTDTDAAAERAQTAKHMATLRWFQGNWGEADRLMKLALELVRDAEPEQYAIRCIDYSVFLASIGSYSDADDYLDKADAALGSDASQHVLVRALLHAARGQLRYARQDYSGAIASFEQARAIFEKTLGLGGAKYRSCIESLAVLNLLNGNAERALETLNPLLDQKDLGVLVTQAWCFTYLGNYERARSLANEADAIATGAMGPDNPWSVAIGTYLAYMDAKEGKFAEAADALERAVARSERSRGTLSSESFRIGSLDQMADLYSLLASVHALRGDAARAFETCERARAKTFIEMLATRKKWTGRLAPVGLVQALDTGIQNLEHKRLAMAATMERSATRGVLNLTESVRELEQSRSAALDKLVQANPWAKELLTVQPAKASDIQARLDRETAVIEYFYPSSRGLPPLLEPQLWIFVVTRDRVELKRHAVDRLELAASAERMHQLLRSDQDAAGHELDALRARLYAMLIKPALDVVGSKTKLVVVPWNKLQGIPFAVLGPVGGPMIGERFEVVLLPSAAVLLHLSRDRAGREGIVAFGNPDTAFVSLPGAERETASIAAMFPKTKVFLNTNATETAATATYSPVDVLHFACHGMLDSQTPQRSYLALAPDAKNDGKLEMHEIYGMDLAGVSLVTLSSCSTGVGSTAPGDEFMALARGFMFAGAPSVLCTLWDVHDDATRLFMESFYRAYTAGKTKSQSLREAQAAIRRNPRYAHPYYWAPFVLWGRP